MSEVVSLDGVVQDPTGEEGFVRGGWFLQAGAADRDAWAELELAEARGAAALLLGRRSDDWFAARWPSRRGEWADRLNSMPKYVVSTTLQKPRWSNSTILDGEVVTEVATLRQEVDGDVVVYASAQLVRALMDHDLVDELRLTMVPVLLGMGERIFGRVGEAKPLQLVGSRTVGRGLVHLTYRPIQYADTAASPRPVGSPSNRR